MAAKKFTKADIVDAVYEKTGLNRGDIRKVIDLSISEIKAALLGRCIIELRGFGTFEIKIRKARPRARNPRTGEIISIRSHGNVSFRPGRELRQDAWNITDEDLPNP
ncbi:MAG: integration host factor subunit beta [Treponema sp.]|jgi:integration host factor subunit beta|nr:integration host factor subunit beta [Treponema sp.]